MEITGIPQEEILSSGRQNMRAAVGRGAGPYKAKGSQDREGLRDHARIESSRWRLLESCASSDVCARPRRMIAALLKRLAVGDTDVLRSMTADEQAWVLDNLRLLRTALRETQDLGRELRKQPHVQNQEKVVSPRVRVVASAFLRATGFAFDSDALAAYLEGWQEHQKLAIGEIWLLRSMLQFLLLEAFALDVLKSVPKRGQLHLAEDAGIRLPCLITSQRRLGDEDWKILFQEVSTVEAVLRRDPAGVFVGMDYDSRDQYRREILKLARYSDVEETEAAETAVALAAAALERDNNDPRVRARESHVGFYLIDRGIEELKRQIGFRPPLEQRLRGLLYRFPNLFYLAGIEIVTLLIVWLVLGGLPVLIPIVISFFFLLIPATQAAIELINNVVTSLLPASRLPKLDFSDGIPADCKTMVAVPTLLLHEEQVAGLAEQLEIRYLANRDPNLYFCLLTDAPDSDVPFDEKEALAEFCSNLIRGLNRKYGSMEDGPFFLFHRHRTFNPSENVWMGWERKRGKLLDLNQLLRGWHDSFPVKVGNLAVLPEIRFVITLDSDTQLPRDAARKLISTLAHPLNRAIIDPATNTVVAGYGILQPRVGVSVESVTRSRLASVYSGQTGFDIYTRAVSDVYQDLYGEGIFTGKGIYEVDALLTVLNERFPCNSLLSHDLIEGAYARAALVSDIEVIDDYPSHFSAYVRRKHRWVRGDWQIFQWLFRRVPDYNGQKVPNPTTVLSRWKIFDNLRRSLVEPATFFLLLAGWFFLPGKAWYWTLATVWLLLLPTYVQALLSVLWTGSLREMPAVLRNACAGIVKGHFNVLLTLTFLTHQTLVMIDAIIRTVVRHRFTRRKLLEWETAAQAETGAGKRTPVDIYLAWTPWIALLLTLALAWRRPEACVFAAPILLLWANARTVARWLGVRQTIVRDGLKQRDENFLRATALKTWRYFREHVGPGDHWLAPDNVQEWPASIARRVSPTNLGLLLNARQAAWHFGYLTLPELVRETASTLSTISLLATHRGHLLNWYDTRTLEPLEPQFVSTVDSGNLAASLWTLEQGCVSALRRPLFGSELWRGIHDHIQIIDELRPGLPGTLKALAEPLEADELRWIAALDVLEREVNAMSSNQSEPDGEIAWWTSELRERLRAVRKLVGTFAPWCGVPGVQVSVDQAIGKRSALGELTLENLPRVYAQLDTALKDRHPEMRQRLTRAAVEADSLGQELRRLASQSSRLVQEMEFEFLYDRRKKLLVVGYDVRKNCPHPSCYDLLGSEARTAAFIAIAKGDIPQESWVHLGRAQTVYKRRRILLSWTGTMFEYLMPALWMRIYPRTVLEQSVRGVVEAQQIYCRRKRIPWGISESAYSHTDRNGYYQYYAFGLPLLALKRAENRSCVVAPYSTFLALHTHRDSALENLWRMAEQGWMGRYGFYEAVDFGADHHDRRPATLVKCWMAHHQAMSLISIANCLLNSPFQEYFHSEPQVMATELLLHERIPAALKVEAEPDPEALTLVPEPDPAAA